MVTSKLGRVLIAVRDAESRVRFLGLLGSTRYQIVRLHPVGDAGRHRRRALYVPQVGIINPGEFTPAKSIEVAIWVAVGGRGTLFGAAAGRG